jgi:hypothetical protein
MLTLEASQAEKDVRVKANEIKDAQEAIKEEEKNLRINSASLGEVKAKKAAHEDNRFLHW